MSDCCDGLLEERPSETVVIVSDGLLAQTLRTAYVRSAHILLIEFKFYMGYGLLCRLLSRCRSGFGFRQGRRLLGQMADFLFVVDDGDADTGVSVDWVLTSNLHLFYIKFRVSI